MKYPIFNGKRKYVCIAVLIDVGYRGPKEFLHPQIFRCWVRDHTGCRAIKSIVGRLLRLLAVRDPDVLDLRRARRKSRPPLILSSDQSRATVSIQVCLRLPAEAFSTALAPSAVAEVPDGVDAVVLGELLAERRRLSPVTMLTTPPGTSEVSSTW